MKELIKHAALKSKNGWIFIGKCHGDCMEKMQNIKVEISDNADDQGFVTSNGRFFDRHKSAKLAYAYNQIDKETSLLFSEDLWSEEYNGKHDYDEIEGYKLRGEL